MAYVTFYTAICGQLARKFVIECRTIWWAEYAAGMGERRVAYSGLVGKTEYERPLGRLTWGVHVLRSPNLLFI